MRQQRLSVVTLKHLLRQGYKIYPPGEEIPKVGKVPEGHVGVARVYAGNYKWAFFRATERAVALAQEIFEKRKEVRQ